MRQTELAISYRCLVLALENLCALHGAAATDVKVEPSDSTAEQAPSGPRMGGLGERRSSVDLSRNAPSTRYRHLTHMHLSPPSAAFSSSTCSCQRTSRIFPQLVRLYQLWLNNL